MFELQTTHIKPVLPKREWLLRCNGNDRNLSTCSICVSNGNIEIVTENNTIIELVGADIVEFHYAFQAAIELADADLAARKSGIPDV